MKLNCKPGDLAIICKMPWQLAQTNDRIVRLKNQPAVDGIWDFEEAVPMTLLGRLDGLPQGLPMRLTQASDENLRPIRDNPGDDQTLEWAGLPAGHGVPA